MLHFEALRWLWLHGHHARHVMHLRGMYVARFHHTLHHGTRWVHRWANGRTGRIGR